MFSHMEVQYVLDILSSMNDRTTVAFILQDGRIYGLFGATKIVDWLKIKFDPYIIKRPYSNMNDICTQQN